MTTIEEWETGGSDAEALLHFNTREMVTANELASLITALANQYTQLSPGRQLVISEVRTGSLWLLIADSVVKGAPLVKAAADYVAAGNAVAKLVGAIRAALERSKADPQTLGGRHAGARVVREAVKIAAQHGSAMEVRWKYGRGEELSVRLEANEARQLQSASEHRPRLPAAERFKQLPSTPRALPGPEGTIAEHAAAIANMVGNGKISGDTRRAVRAIVEALTAMGLGERLDDIARELRASGRADVARLIS